MRRSPLRYLPVAVLALTLQVLAPLMALAPLAAPFDPLIHAALCSDLAQDLAQAEGGDRSSHRGGAEAACCVLCAPLTGGVAVLDPPAGIAGVLPEARFWPVAWLAVDRHLPTASLNLAAAPRAPPVMA